MCDQWVTSCRKVFKALDTDGNRQHDEMHKEVAG